MSDASVPAPPPAAASGSGPVGKVRNPWAVIGLTLITCGIYFLYWTYQVYREMKERTGNGLGGPVGLVIGIFIGVVNLFVIPSEIANMYRQSGREAPISAIAGLWNLIPLVGYFIWQIKVQNALNDEWVRGGASPL